jgi:predicted DNA-binding mobile mystery protein A
MKNRRLQIEQLNEKLKPYRNAGKVIRPGVGWVKAIRTSVGMSLEQLANKLGISKQSAHGLERREQDGSITLRALEEVAKAMDMKVVYALVPVDGNVEKWIEARARKIATEIVLRTSNTMKLEDQENTPARIKKAIDQKTIELCEEMPKMLWD